MNRFLKLFLTFTALLCLLCGTAGAQVYLEEEPPADWADRSLLRLTVFKTGESDCMLLEAGGECMMVDGGIDKFRAELRDALEARGISHFKYLFSTHPHDDHITGLRRLVQFGFTADAFLSPFKENFRNDNQKKTVDILKKYQMPYQQVKDGDELTLGDARIRVHRWDDGKTVNAMSAMLKITFGDARLLLCADIIGETQHYFLQNLDADELKADIVKAPHHGLTPFVTEFLDAVDPELIFITNYKNATPKTVDQAVYRHLPYLHAASGTIVMETDGTDWYVRQTLKKFDPNE